MLVLLMWRENAPETAVAVRPGFFRGWWASFVLGRCWTPLPHRVCSVPMPRDTLDTLGVVECATTLHEMRRLGRQA